MIALQCYCYPGYICDNCYFNGYHITTARVDVVQYSKIHTIPWQPSVRVNQYPAVGSTHIPPPVPLVLATTPRVVFLRFSVCQVDLTHYQVVPDGDLEYGRGKNAKKKTTKRS